MEYLRLSFFSYMLISVAFHLNSYAQDTIKIMSYNVLEFDNPEYYTPKLNALRNIINTVDPDIFIGVEIFDDLDAADYFRTSVLNNEVLGEYDLVTQPSPTNAYGLGGGDNGKYSNFLYYKDTVFTPIDDGTIVVDDGKWPTLVYRLHHPHTNNTIIIYGVHLSSTTQAQRENEADSILNSAADYNGEYVIVAGDFNFDGGSGEDAYTNLTSYFVDPGSFAYSYRTYSTSSLSLRYDMILNSQTVVSGGYVQYNSGSFDVIGTTGGIYQTASDHLPVYADYEFTYNPTPVELISFTGILNGNKVDLYWRTATEVNNYGFNIERSSSSLGTIWKTIGFVQGHGNSNSPKEYTFVDTDINQSGRYFYRLKQIDNDGAFEYSNTISVEVGTPHSYDLSQNYPNPFNPLTKIEFTIPQKEMVSLKIFNSMGELVSELINEEKEAGSYSVDFDASGLASGMYVYRFQAGTFISNKKMILLK